MSTILSRLRLSRHGVAYILAVAALLLLPAMMLLLRPATITGEAQSGLTQREAGARDRDSDGATDVADNCSTINRAQTGRDKDGKDGACDQNLFLGVATYDPRTESPNLPSHLLGATGTGVYIVQHHNRAGEKVRAAIAALPRAHYVGPIVQDAALWLLPETDLDRIKAIDGVRYAMDYQPAHKFERNLLESLRGATVVNNKTASLTVVLFEPPGSESQAVERVSSQVTAWGGKATHLRGPYLDVALPTGRIADLARLTDVRRIEVKAMPKPLMNVAVGLTDVRAPGANPNNTWVFGLTGAGERIGITDTGLSIASTCDSTGVSPGFDNCNSSNMFINQDLQKRLVAAIQLNVEGAAIPGADVTDELGHGTHVTGIALGDGATSADNDVDPPIKGVAYQSTYVAIKLNPDDAPTPHAAAVSATNSLNADQLRGANIHSFSIGTSILDLNGEPAILQSIYTEASKAIDAFLQANPYDVSIRAAGNEGPAMQTITQEGTAKNNLTVAASENVKPDAYQTNPPIPGAYADIATQLYSLSSTGPVRGSSRLKPDVTAPGTSIAAVRSQIAPSANPNPQPPYAAYPYPGVLTNDYTYASGTSMATPHVAGMAALIRQYLRQPNPLGNPTITDPKGPTGDLLKAFIINGAVDMYTGEDGSFRCYGIDPKNCYDRIPSHIPSDDQGWGLVNLENSLKPCGDNLCQFFDAAPLARGYQQYSYAAAGPGAGIPASLVKGQVKHYRFRMSRTQQIAVTLTWYDPADAIGSGTIVNDLDLRVRTPTGVLYRGGVPSFSVADQEASTGQSHPNRPRDKVNNTEKLLLSVPPEDGFYDLAVAASKLGEGATQPYALVVTGIKGADATDQVGEPNYIFRANDTVYMGAVGMPAGTTADAYVVAYGDVDYLNGGSFPLHDVRGNPTAVTSHAVNGTLQTTALWPKAVVGSYNIVIDVNRNGQYDKDIDIVDYTGKPGFRVVDSGRPPLSLFTTAAAPVGTIVNLTEQKRRFEFAGSSASSVNAAGSGMPASSPVNLYVVPYLPQFNWNNQKLATVKLLSVTPNPVAATTDKNGNLPVTTVWVSPDEDTVIKSGKKYQLIADIDRDGIFNPTVDAIDKMYVRDIAAYLVQNNAPLALNARGNAVSELQLFLTAWNGTAFSNSEWQSQTFNVNVENSLIQFAGKPYVDTSVLRTVAEIGQIGFALQPKAENIEATGQPPAIIGLYGNLSMTNVVVGSGADTYYWTQSAAVTGTSVKDNAELTLNTGRADIRGSTLINQATNANVTVTCKDHVNFGPGFGLRMGSRSDFVITCSQ